MKLNFDNWKHLNNNFIIFWAFFYPANAQQCGFHRALSKMEISIRYQVIIISQSNDYNLLRRYIILTNLLVDTSAFSELRRAFLIAVCLL